MAITSPFSSVKTRAGSASIRINTLESVSDSPKKGDKDGFVRSVIKLRGYAQYYVQVIRMDAFNLLRLFVKLENARDKTRDIVHRSLHIDGHFETLHRFGCDWAYASKANALVSR